MLTLWRTTRTEERGAVVVIVAAMILPLTLLLAFALETGWWWTHHRHLQTQADAGALAGAQGPWFLGSDPSGCAETTIETNTRQYSSDLGIGISGVPPGGGSNAQYSNATNVHTLINAMNPPNGPRYWWDPDPAKTGSNFSDGSTPCQSLLANNGHLDVNVTDAGLPTFFGSLPFFGRAVRSVNVHARARIELQQLGAGSGSLPVGVPDTNPVDGAAIFVNESAGNTPPPILSIARLNKLPTPPNPVSLNGRYLTEWDTDPVSVGIHDPNTGVVIAFTGNPNNPNWLQAGDLTTICNQPLVECYQGEDSGTYTGLSFIHGYTNGGGTPWAPNLGSVTVQKNGCADDSAPYFLLRGCNTPSVSADIDFGGATDIQVAVDAPGCPNGNPAGCPMTLDANGLYTTQGSLPSIPAGAGPKPLTINWKDKDPNAPQNGHSKNNSNSFGNAQRIYSANDDPVFSGPVEYVRVEDPSTGDAKNSVHFNDSISFKVKVGIQGNFATQSQVNDPIVKLRVIGGSRNQSLDCDPSPGHAVDSQDPTYTTLWEELAYGCYPQYTRNEGTNCPNGNTALWSLTQPPAWPCVALQTGSAKNQVPEGMNTRVLGTDKPSSCPALGQPGHNNWYYDPDADGKPNLPDGDPRLLFVFVTPFGSFTGSGSGTVPVQDFAEFYVTGWTGQGQGFNNPCENNGDDPVPGPAYIVGHFVKYAPGFPSGSGTGDPCITTDPSVIDPCIAVLTQ